MNAIDATLGALLPPAPQTLADTGLDPDTVVELLLKALQRGAGATGGELARRVGLPFGIIEAGLEQLRGQQYCEVTGGSILGGSSFRYRLTEKGQHHALRALERNQYAGIAPVPIAQYRAYMAEFTRDAVMAVSPREVREACADLVVSDAVLDELGPAINARHSIFIYGPPGNGKSQMARRIQRLLSGTLAVPHALDVEGQIIRFFDPSVHEIVPSPDAEHDDSVPRFDRRWVHCRRPMVSVGGELTLESLALAYNQRSGTYRAPVQTLANGGVLVIDDFGRQQCSPRDLLNWWMVPLESRVEYMTLMSGEKIEMPFEALVIFSTNIRPSDLVDEAFLRRIRYKIHAANPDQAEYATIFQRCCAARGVPFDRALIKHLFEHVYRPRNLEPRGCHPRDLIGQALALAEYRGQPLRLTVELLDAAADSYFLVDDEPLRGRPHPE